MTRDTNRFARTSGTRPMAAAIAGPLGVAALVATVGCGARGPAGPLSADAGGAGAAQAGAPIIVSCEPNQRTLVRPVVVNGATVSQVECITSGAVPIATATVRGPGAGSVPSTARRSAGGVRTRR